MEKNALFILILIFMMPVCLSAQSNDVLDDFLDRDAADFGTTVYLVLASTGEIDESATIEEALDWIIKSDELSRIEDISSRRNISYGEFSYILMEVLDIKGGLMYRMVPGPRYAAREAAYRNWLLGSSFPGRVLKPFEVINTLVSIVESEGGES